MTDTIEVLNGSGHLSLTWDPSNPEEVAKAKEEVEALKAAGYTFFEVAEGNLIVERVKDPVRPPPYEAAPSPEPGPSTVSEEQPRRKRGRPRKSDAAPTPAPPQGRRMVAVRQMQGG